MLWRKSTTSQTPMGPLVRKVGLKAVTHWRSVCLARMRPWVPYPAAQKKCWVGEEFLSYGKCLRQRLGG